MARLLLNRISIERQQQSFRACLGINAVSSGAKKRQRKGPIGDAQARGGSRAEILEKYQLHGPTPY